jgi:hypothetical protein
LAARFSYAKTACSSGVTTFHDNFAEDEGAMRELKRARFGNLFASPLLETTWEDGEELNAQLRDSIGARASAVG